MSEGLYGLCGPASKIVDDQQCLRVHDLIVCFAYRVPDQAIVNRSKGILNQIWRRSERTSCIAAPVVVAAACVSEDLWDAGAAVATGLAADSTSIFADGAAGCDVSTAGAVGEITASPHGDAGSSAPRAGRGDVADASGAMGGGEVTAASRDSVSARRRIDSVARRAASLSAPTSATEPMRSSSFSFMAWARRTSSRCASGSFPAIAGFSATNNSRSAAHVVALGSARSIQGEKGELLEVLGGLRGFRRAALDREASQRTEGASDAA